jgi:nitrogen fixation protein NifU and related proteins
MGILKTKEDCMPTDLYKEHFLHPQNAYYIPDPDGVGSSGDPECGDSVTMYIKIREDRIEEISYLVFGCSGAIAVSSMISVLAKGRSLSEASSITEEDVIKAFDVFPQEKNHCSMIAVKALQSAILNYYATARLRAESTC